MLSVPRICFGVASPCNTSSRVLSSLSAMGKGCHDLQGFASEWPEKTPPVISGSPAH